MCLAKVYGDNDSTLLMENAARIDEDGEFLTIRDILGEEKRVRGTIASVDLAGSVVRLNIHEIIGE